MKSWMFTLVATAGLSLAFAAQAEEGAFDEAPAAADWAQSAEQAVETGEAVEAEEAVGETPSGSGIEAFAEENLSAELGTDEIAAAAVEFTPEAIEASRQTVESGSAAVDHSGKRGNIHVVERGDTLWDISNTYLKTPWVWPAVWEDNDAIANPHRIFPGDHIWISATEMRKVTPEEAVEMVELASVEIEDFQEEPAAPAEFAVLEDMPAAMEEPEAFPVAPAAPAQILRTLNLPQIENFGYISEEQLDGATSIVSSPSARTWITAGDPIVIGLGEGETAVGEQYDIFSHAVPVRDPRTGRTYGYHIDVLGWAEVTQIHGDSSTAVI